MSQDQSHPTHLGGASEEELAAMLRWYVEMGVDLAIGDEPRDHFAEAATQAQAPAVPAPRPTEEASSAPAGARVAPRLAPEPLPVRAASGQGAVAPEEAVAEARRLAAGAATLEELDAALAGFDGCTLKRTASHTVFAQIAAGAALVIVGDAPSAEDDREGRIFSGRGGQMLDRMLASIGLTRASAHLVNVAPWRPPGGRGPTPPEIAMCLAFVHRYIELAQPSLIVGLGDLPSRQLLGAREPIVRARGKWLDCNGVPALPMLSPDYLIKAPPAKKHAWSDLRALKAALQEQGLS